jgi:hypothetical protein
VNREGEVPRAEFDGILGTMEHPRALEAKRRVEEGNMKGFSEPGDALTTGNSMISLGQQVGFK